MQIHIPDCSAAFADATTLVEDLRSQAAPPIRVDVLFVPALPWDRFIAKKAAQFLCQLAFAIQRAMVGSKKLVSAQSVEGVNVHWNLSHTCSLH